MARDISEVKWVTVRPRTGWFDINLRELARYRDLIFLLVKRYFTLIYKQTILGPLWVVIQPLLTSMVFTVVFGVIAGMPTDGIPTFLFYMCGNLAWHYFQSCLTSTSNTFISNSRLFGKVYFPRLCMPISVVLSQLINFFVQYALFVILVVIYAVRPGSAVKPDIYLMLLTPVMLMQMAALGLGFGIIVSSLTTKYRDLALLVSFGASLWMYATPVAYSTSLVAERFPALMWLYMLNPMTPVIELFRSAYLGTGYFSAGYYMISWLVTLIVLAIGVVLFSRTEKTFMDTV